MNTMHEAETYLRNTENPNQVYVKIQGKRRRLFINSDGTIGIIAVGKRNRGYIFYDWSAIEKVYYPASEENTEKKMVIKYQRLAKKATHKNSWLECIANADPEKSLWENRITTGTRIDGKCISLKSVEKHCGTVVMSCFKDALRNRINYQSMRFDFNGYDGSLFVTVQEDGTVNAGFAKEYRNCGNGYYYLLINDDTFIGYDVD